MAKWRYAGASLLTVFALLAPALLALAPALFSTDAAALTDPASPTLWLKYSGNPVLAPGQAGAFDSAAILSNSVVRYEGKYLLYYSGYSGSGYKVGLATSSDGRLFLKYAGNPIISNGANASVIKDGADFKMWYIGEGGIRHATSDDGRLWNDYPSNPVMEPGRPDEWDASFRNVNVMRDGNVYKMWYSGGKQDDVRIGYATSPDGLRWTKHAGNPIVVQEIGIESAQVHSPCVLRVSDEYRMWYSASNGQITRICYASSADGIQWTKYAGNPLMPASSQWESPNNLCPVVLFDGRDYRMWYSGADDSMQTRIGCADSTTTGPFAPSPLTPADNAWTNGSMQAFGWSFGSGGADQSAFQFQLDDDLGFGSPAVDTGKLPSSERSYSPAEPLTDGTHYWRVRAWDASGEDSAWSSVWTVKLDTAGPAVHSFTINEGAAFTANPAVRLSVNASDPEPGSGIAGLRYSLDGAEWTAWEPFRTDFSASLAGSDQKWTVKVELRDRVNNTGPAASASILVDTTPPQATFLHINNGAAFTNNRTVTLVISSEDPTPGTGLADMAFSSDGTPWTPWEPFCTTRSYNLTTGDGPKAVQVKVRDQGGTAGSPASASITLDTTPPATSLLRIPALSEETGFAVSWTGSDALAGIGGFDVEYRENDGPWTAWLNGTNLTTAAFTGQDGSAYTFRARSFDRTGNIEPFLANVSLTVRVVLPRPTVAILDPEPQKLLRARYLVGGTSAHPKPGRAVTLVEVSVDGGPWVPAEGTLSWTYTLDTAKLKNGMHNITARSFDGTKYSDTAVTAFKVANEPQSAPMDFLPVLLLVLAIVVVGVSASFFVLRGRGPKAPPVPPRPPPPDPD